MKILFLLFAVVFLVFQTQTEASVLEKNEVQEQAQDQVEGKAQDEVMAEDDAAEIPSPNAGRFLRPIICQFGSGVCRGRCLSTEYPSARCSSKMNCCKKQ